MRKVSQANLKNRRRSKWTIKVYHIVCPECQRILEENFSNRKAMLFMRWKKAFHNRYAGTDCKTLIGAVAKRYGIERMGKGGMKPSVASHEAERK